MLNQLELIVQWVITLIVGLLTFFGGRVFERHKLAQANRLKLLEPVMNFSLEMVDSRHGTKSLSE